VNGPERRRYNRSWKLAASLLGIVALVAAGATVSLLDLAAPWEPLVCFAVVAIVLLGGTLWLVPSTRVKHVQRTEGTTDPWY
jgi:peptidoglycan/LPS O-acetylase OafA/YrhL